MASLALVGCGTGEPAGLTTTDDLRALRRWTVSAPSAYEFTLGRSCFCGQETLRPVVVSVRNGAVEALRYADDGAAIPLTRAGEFPTIDRLFEIIAEVRARPKSTVTVQYDLDRGYPVNVALDYDAGMADDEMLYSVRGFGVR
jgi:hypothetical protein